MCTDEETKTNNELYSTVLLARTEKNHYFPAGYEAVEIGSLMELICDPI